MSEKRSYSVKQRKVYFYSLDLRDSSGKDVLSESYDIMLEVFNKNARTHVIKLSNGKDFEIKSLRLNDGGEFTVMDILSNDRNFLFARVGKSNSIVEMQKRDYETYGFKDVLAPEEIGKSGVEIFTHFLLDYQTGIVSFIYSQGAPSQKVLDNIINQYTQSYVMRLSNIVSKDNVRALMKPGSEIMSLSYAFKIPDRGYLEELKVPQKAIKQFVNDDELEVQIVVKNKKRKSPIVIEGEKIKGFVSGITQMKHNKEIHNISIEGKQTNSKKKKYTYSEQDFNANVSIKFEVDENGQYLLDSESFRARVKELLKTEYSKNKDELLLLINKAIEV